MTEDAKCKAWILDELSKEGVCLLGLDEQIRRVLERMEAGGLVTPSGGSGWELTSRGKGLARDLKELLEKSAEISRKHTIVFELKWTLTERAAHSDATDLEKVRGRWRAEALEVAALHKGRASVETPQGAFKLLVSPAGEITDALGLDPVWEEDARSWVWDGAENP